MTREVSVQTAMSLADETTLRWSDMGEDDSPGDAAASAEILPEGQFEHPG